MKKKDFSYYGSYRAPRTTQEIRLNHEHREYVRGKRSKKNIPSAYDDVHNSSWDLRKSWKIKRKTQYRPEGRGKKHEIYVESWKREWIVTGYFEEQDIPFRVRHHYENYWYTYVSYHDGKEKTVRASRLLGFHITYWTNKEIIIPLRLLE